MPADFRNKEYFCFIEVYSVNNIVAGKVMFRQGHFDKQSAVTGTSLVREFRDKSVHSINDDSSTDLYQ